MAIRVALHHKTLYRYDRPVQLAPHVVRLRPAPHCRTPIHAYSLQVFPTSYLIHWQQDPQANYQARLVFSDSTTEFSVTVDLIAEMVAIDPFDFFLEPEAAQYPFTYDAISARELCPYLEAQPAGPKWASFLAEIPRETVGTLDFLVSLNRLLQREIGYVHRLEPGIQTCEETLDCHRGSCRDSAWLFVQIARRLGLAARFVSGYLIQLKSETGDPAVDGADLHAWAEVYLPGAGWVGFDPTSGLLASVGHIPLACTADATSAAPISGRLGPCETEFHHQMTVERVPV
jgi:transglutaminase-like putative cysteine protease